MRKRGIANWTWAVFVFVLLATLVAVTSDASSDSCADSSDVACRVRVAVQTILEKSGSCPRDTCGTRDEKPTSEGIPVEDYGKSGSTTTTGTSAKHK